MMIQRKLFANFRNHRVFNLSEADIAHRELIVRLLCISTKLMLPFHRT